MLHMVVNSHNPESCAFRGPEEEQLLSSALDAFEQSAAGAEVTIQGSWVNRAGHEIFFLVDAPSAHAVEGLLMDAGLVGRTRSRIVPVIDPEQP